MSLGFQQPQGAQSQVAPTAVRPVYLAGLGTSLPDRCVDNEEIASRLADLTAAGIEKRTGIRQRYFAEAGQNTSDLATAAARIAIADAEVDPQTIDLIVVATATPDHLMPATACRVQHELGATRAATFDLSAACSGFVYAMWVGQQFIQSGQSASVLVVGAEVMSRIVDPADPKCGMLFGDGGGAAVLTAAEGPYRLGRFTAQTWGDQYHALLRDGGSAAPLSAELLDAGQHFLRMDGRRVFRAAVAGFREAILQTAMANQLTVEQVDWIVPHQANRRIFGEVAERLNISLERFWLNLDRYGNTVAASVPLALQELHDEVGPVPGSRLLLACVGAGMCGGGTVLFAD